MKAALLTTSLLTISGLTTFAWAAGIDSAMLRSLPWREIFLLALPAMSIAGLRLRRLL
ncbi:MAG: hypothetical protein AAF225_01310 [Pseudomonadota bacterium]